MRFDRITKKDLDKRLGKIEESLGYDAKVYVRGFAMGIQEAITLIVKQLGTIEINKDG